MYEFIMDVGLRIALEFHLDFKLEIILFKQNICISSRKIKSQLFVFYLKVQYFRDRNVSVSIFAPLLRREKKAKKYSWTMRLEFVVRDRRVGPALGLPVFSICRACIFGDVVVLCFTHPCLIRLYGTSLNERKIYLSSNSVYVK